MTEFAQQLVNALSLGGTYSLLALGVAVVLSLLGFINFAHGELITLGGYALYYCMTRQLPFVAAATVAILASAVAAVLMERVAFRPVRGGTAETLLLTSFALGAGLQVIFQTTIAPNPLAVPLPSWLSGTWTVGSLQLGRTQVFSIVITAIALTAMVLFLKRTPAGLGIRAAASDFDVTRLMGIRANLLISETFFISGLLAGAASILLVAQRGTVDPYMGFAPVLVAFVAVVVGGMGGLLGPVVAAWVLGTVQSLFSAYLPVNISVYSNSFLWLVVIVVLLLRPNGILRSKAA